MLGSAIMTATSTAASSLPPVRTSCHVPLSLMTSISEETIALWLKLGALEKLEQAVLDGYGDQLCGKTSRIPQVNKFLKQVPLFQNKIREIHQAVSQGRLRDVQHLIDRKKLAFCRDHNGASPLHKAVIFGHQDVIEYLVKRYGGSIHIRDHQGRTALHYAAFLPDRGEIYQYLLANGADERAMDVYGRQPSYYLDGQNENTLRQLRDGSTMNGLRKIKPRYYGQVSTGTPFSNSSRPTVTKSQIRELISEGNLNALEDLVLQGQGDRLLGETSPVPKIQSFLNLVPMYMERIYDVHRAVMRDQLEHVVILLENKKLAMARDQLGATPLHKAVLFGHYKIAHYVSQQFPDALNATDTEGRTALHYAAALKDNKNMYGILIEAGVNKGLYDNKGKTADYYAQYPEHLNLEDVIKRCHKVNANYLANTANRIKGKSPVRQTPPPSNGNLSSPRSDENNASSKENSQSNDSGNENELMSLLQKDTLHKRLDMSSANIRKWVNANDMDKLTKAVMEGYGEKVVRVNTNEESEDKDQITSKVTEMVERINAIHSAVSSDDLTELQNHLEEKDFALAKDHIGNTPLHKSVLLRKTKIVGFLIEKFPETINAKNKNGLTALHYAVAMSRKDGQELCKMLLQAGADPKIRDNHGRTPDYYKTHLITLPNKGMMRSRPIGGRHSETLNRYSKQGVLERMTTALQRGDVDLLQDLVLEGHGKHLFGKTSWNEDVKAFLKELPSYINKILSFHEATKIGDLEKVKELVSSNEKLMRARDESGALPMHIAAASESIDVLQYFVKNYPSALNVKDSTGKTALHVASLRGNQEICKMLKQAGADPKILDQKGKTAEFYLQSAIKDGPRIEYESSKSSVNSSSESTFSIVNKTPIPRRKSRKSLKTETLVKCSAAAGEKASEENKKSSQNNKESEINTSETAENTDPKQNTSETNDADKADDGEEVEKNDEKALDSTPQDIGNAPIENENANEQENDISPNEETCDDDKKNSSIVKNENVSETEDSNAVVVESNMQITEDSVNNSIEIEEVEEEKKENIQITETESNEIEEKQIHEQNEEVAEEQKIESENSKCESVESNENILKEDTLNLDETKNDTNDGHETAGTINCNETEETKDNEHVESEEVATKDENENKDSDNVDNQTENASENCDTEEGIIDTVNATSVNKNECEFENSEEHANESDCKEANDSKRENSPENVTVTDVGNDEEENTDKLGTSMKSEADNELEQRGPESAENELEDRNENSDVQNDTCNENESEETKENNETENEENNIKETENEETENGETKNEEINIEGTENEETKNDETRNGETKSEVTENEETKSEETQNDENKSEESENEVHANNENTSADNNENLSGNHSEQKNEEKENENEEKENENEEKETENKEKEVENEEKKSGKKENETENENITEGERENVDDDESKINTELDNLKEKVNDESDNIENKNDNIEESTRNETINGETDDSNKENCSNHIETKNDISDETPHQTKDHLDELIEHWIKEGDLLRLEHVVLAGQGDRLIERTSEDKQVQDFLDLVPIYMAKIRAVHEAVAKGQLREVRSVLTRKRFALSRDHVGASPLHLAVLHGHTDVSTYIISHFPETMDGPDNEGRTPLHYASALRDNGTLYRLLKAAGADENIEDKSGHSPKYYMSQPGELSLEHLLESYAFE